jgi:hypothetical protein
MKCTFTSVNITQIEKQFYHLLSEEDIRGGKISFRDTETGNTVLIWVRNDDVARDLLPNRPANILHVVVAIVANDSLEDTHLISPEQFMQHAPPERHAELADIKGFSASRVYIARDPAGRKTQGFRLSLFLDKNLYTLECDDKK